MTLEPCVNHDRWMGGCGACDAATERARDGELAALRASSADDLRALGWTVAVHNDYRLSGKPHTFWLVTKGERALKGEGATDAEALGQIRLVLRTDAAKGGGDRG